MRRVGGPETVRHVLVDGNNILHKAFHTINAEQVSFELLENRFVDLISSYLRKIGVFTTVNVFFDGVSRCRLAKYPAYKAGRNSEGITTDSSARDKLYARLRAFGHNIYHSHDHESDDLIATFCEINRDSIRIIVSEDKDFFALLSDSRVVIFKPSYASNFVDAEASMNIWGLLNKGKHPRVPPECVRMFKSLCGDPSDNIIGVSRLRKNVAARLASAKSMDVLLSDLPDWLTDKEKASIFMSADVLRMNYDIIGFEEVRDLNKYCKPGFKLLESDEHDHRVHSVDASVFDVI